MRRTILKRGFLLCTVFLLLINICSPCVFSLSGSLSGESYTSSYMPVCPTYPTLEQAPYGKDTHCFCFVNNNYISWFFYTSVCTLKDTTYHINQGDTYNDSYTYDSLSFYLKPIPSDTSRRRVYILSGSPIIRVFYNKSTGSMSRTVSGTYSNGSYSDNLITFETSGYYDYTFDLPTQGNVYEYISDIPYIIEGYSADFMCQRFPSLYNINDFSVPYYIAQYPDSVSVAITSIQDNTDLLIQYYNTLNNKINALQSDHIILYNQNNELLSELSSLRGQIPEEISSGNQEVVSEVNENISSAVDDINNAGEDISDIDDDISDVNSIVEKCSEWVSSLDNFADNIDEAESGVAQG